MVYTPAFAQHVHAAAGTATSLTLVQLTDSMGGCVVTAPAIWRLCCMEFAPVVVTLRVGVCCTVCMLQVADGGGRKGWAEHEWVFLAYRWCLERRGLQTNWPRQSLQDPDGLPMCPQCNAIATSDEVLVMHLYMYQSNTCVLKSRTPPLALNARQQLQASQHAARLRPWAFRARPTTASGWQAAAVALAAVAQPALVSHPSSPASVP